jgi:ubiquinone/menaquinone biosynthesis C-methylase UbiE
MKLLPKSIHPTTILLFFKQLYYLPIDSYEYITGKRPFGVPPRGKTGIVHSEYVKAGEKYLTYFREFAGLQQQNSVLDVGCGIGCIAVPLTRFLNEKGSYEGFDIVKSDINWCNKNISAKHPNFHFQYSGFDNQPNKAEDKTDACNFIFPYDDAKFDFVCLTSVFTHMMPAEVEQYINETGRVMKTGATSLISLFIVNCESEDLMIKKPTQMNFPFNKGFYRLHSLQAENKQVAYDEEWLLEKLSTAGLKMEGIKYGNWCGRNSYFDYQDLLICRKV